MTMMASRACPPPFVAGAQVENAALGRRLARWAQSTKWIRGRRVHGQPFARRKSACRRQVEAVQKLQESGRLPAPALAAHGNNRREAMSAASTSASRLSADASLASARVAEIRLA